MPQGDVTSGKLTGGDSPEKVSRQYHLLRVVVTIAVVGVVTLLIGLAALIDPENLHPVKYLAGCLGVAVTCGALLLVLRQPNLSVGAVDIAIFLGLSSTFANTVYGGLLGVDPWWQVCAYLVVIMIAGGVAIRRLTTFTAFIVLSLLAWIIVVNKEGLSDTFIFDSYVLMILGALVAGAILLLFRTERRRVTSLNRKLLSNATHDSLTGVMNRVGLLRSLTGDPEGLIPPIEATWCAYLDVDYFKSINDRHGHDHGDDVLRLVAAALNEASTESSLTARWGGDEFILIGSGAAPSETDLESKVNRRIREIEPGGSVSVGISQSVGGRDIALADLLELADKRMYYRRNQIRTRNVSANG